MDDLEDGGGPSSSSGGGLRGKGRSLKIVLFSWLNCFSRITIDPCAYSLFYSFLGKFQGKNI
jgi:hypothetical protein